ncbi:MAG: hypothetical protein IJV88_01710 [Ruminococcus sp.]|nr:hypothetical protein [Ruminococcus sp.]
MNNKKAHIAIIAIFLVFTFAFSVLFFAIPKTDYSSTEKRHLAQMPEVSLENFFSGKLTTALEGGTQAGYIADHFPFRSFFVGLNSYWNLGIGSTASNGYYFAQDGYIITKPSQVNDSDLVLSRINQFSASFDEVAMMVVPSAGYMLQEKLPLNRVDYPDAQVYDYILANKAENISFCDVRDTFTQMHRQGTQIYYRTDHHWTSEGAYAAYREVCSVLGQEPVEREAYNVTTYNNFFGTTYSSSGYFLRDPDTIQVWENKALADSIKVSISEIRDGEEVTESFDSMYFESHLQEDDMYPVFLDGNHRLVTIENSKAKTDETLLLLKDSFAHCMAPFLAENYSKIVMVDLRYYAEDVTALAQSEGVDKVLMLYGMDSFCTDATSFANLVFY